MSTNFLTLCRLLIEKGRIYFLKRGFARMNSIHKLHRRGLIAKIGTARQAKAALKWVSDEINLDLLVFYKTREGKIGGVYSSDYPTGNPGKLHEFPFIQLGQSLQPNQQLFKFADLYLYETIQLVVISHEEVKVRTRKSYIEYRPRIELIFDNQQQVQIPLYLRKIGAVLLFCQISTDSAGQIEVLNNIDIVSLKQFQDTVPGAVNIEFDPGISTCRKKYKNKNPHAQNRLIFF